MNVPAQKPKKRIRALWLIPMPVDCIFQSTSRSEAASALHSYAIDVETIAGYRFKSIENPGFAKIYPFKMKSNGIFGRLYNILWVLIKIIKIGPDIIIFSPGIFTLLMPLLRLHSFILRKKQIIILDIRSLQVPKQRKKKHFNVNFFFVALWNANLFAHGITVITNDLKKNISSFVPKKADQIIVWESGVRTDIFNPKMNESCRCKIFDNNDFVIIYHGHLDKSRGLQELIESISILNNFPNVKLLLVGDGDDRLELEELTKKLGVSNRVVFTGRVPYKNVPSYIATADLAVIPLPNDECWNVSSPLKLMEYLAMRIPVIATNIPAHVNVIKIFNGGIIISDHFSQTLANTIGGVISGSIKISPPIYGVEEKINWRNRTIPLANLLWELCDAKKIKCAIKQH